MSRRLLAVCALAGVVLLIYFNALSAYFFEDDFQWLVTRWSFHPSDLLDLSGRTHFYRPIIELASGSPRRLFWRIPRAFHASIVLHAPTASGAARVELVGPRCVITALRSSSSPRMWPWRGQGATDRRHVLRMLGICLLQPPRTTSLAAAVGCGVRWRF
jgi:hypothetical protein